MKKTITPFPQVEETSMLPKEKNKRLDRLRVLYDAHKAALLCAPVNNHNYIINQVKGIVEQANRIIRSFDLTPTEHIVDQGISEHVD